MIDRLAAIPSLTLSITLSCVLCACATDVPASTPPPGITVDVDATPIAPFVPPVEAVEWPRCDAPDVTTIGPADRACAALDGPCLIGVLDAEAGCCMALERKPATPCDEGVCDGLGACVVAPPGADRDRDRDDDGTPDADDAVIGTTDWIRTTLRAVTFWERYDAVEIRVADVPLAAFSAEAGLDLSTIEIDRQVEPFGLVIASSPDAAWSEAYLPRTLGTSTLCLDTLGAAPPGTDCASEGRIEIQCPGAGDGWTCRLDDEAGVAVVRASELRAVWEHEGASIVPVGGFTPGGGVSCSPRCSAGSARACTGGGIALCLPTGCWSPCRPIVRTESCNGRDDDADGRVDEGGTRICDDELGCTLDVCLGVRGCFNSPLNPRCDDDAACTTDRCLHPSGGGPPGPRDSNGCYHVRSDTYCRDRWDGCACNGTGEVCNPAGQSADTLEVSHGCRETPRPSYPCETSRAGDGDACTLELCCEPYDPLHCRLHRLFPVPDVERGESSCGPLAFAATVGVGEVQCGAAGPPLPGIPWPARGAFCEDGQPCTSHACDAATAACSTIFHDNRRPGCDGTTNLGCSAERCMRTTLPGGATTSTCGTLPIPFDHSVDCRGAAEWLTGGTPISTCFEWTCVAGACVVAPAPSACEDDQFCNGDELCATGFLPCPGGSCSFRIPPPGGTDLDPTKNGCGGPSPCDDGVDCTTEGCSEALDTCLIPVANDRFCEARASHVCAPLVCDPRVGCVAGPDPCDDSDACTVDECTGKFGSDGPVVCGHRPDPSCD